MYPEDPLSLLPRAWPGAELPGHREHPGGFATYSHFAFDALPPVGRDLDDDFAWLCAQPPVASSLADLDEAVSRPASPEGLSDLLRGHEVRPPSSFLKFLASDEPRRRIRSATDCYLDLADMVVPVSTGGALIHFLSDSQFCLHWLLFVGADGAEAVVATAEPYGYAHRDDWGEMGQVRATFVPGEDPDACVCATSMQEFLFRLWIENEIFFRLAVDGRPLTGEQQRYLEHYPRVGSDALAAAVSPAATPPDPSARLLTRILRGLGLG